MVAREFARHVEFHHQFAQGWYVVVAFDHRGYLPEELDGACVQIPYGRRNGVVMGIDQVTALITVPGKVKLPDALLRDGVQIDLRVEAVIDATDVDVVDVEQNGTVRALGDFAQELPFAHVGLSKSQIAR